MKILSHRDLTATEAMKITNKIRSCMGDLMGEIAKAHIGRAWLALGYATWTDYVQGEFEYAPLSLPREERRAVTVLLRKQGMSTRAIAAVEGVSDFTVREDLAGARNHAPDLEPLDVDVDEDELAEELIAATVTGLDGKKYQPRQSPPEKPAAPSGVVTVTCPTCGGTGKINQEREYPL
jgi:hypothetical protein